MNERYIVGHCQECDYEVFVRRNIGNITYADTTCHKCGGQVYIDTNDEVSYNSKSFIEEYI